MARKEEFADDEYNTAKTARAISTVGHAAGGGSHPAQSQSGKAVARAIAQGNYVHIDQSDGDQMAGPWVEYPKFLIGDDGKHLLDHHGKHILVQNEEEELTVLAGRPVVREPEERKRLLKVAEVKGVQVDGRWALPKITKAIEDAGHDASLNPFE